jgi:predicted alpha/beta-fold hydrolase
MDGKKSKSQTARRIEMHSVLSLYWVLFSQGWWWPFTSGIQRVCYNHIGCFSNQSPFDNARGSLPDSPEKIQITFSLYTTQNKETAQFLEPYNSSTITSSYFAASRPTVFITHGFTDTTKSGWAQQMKNALLQKASYFVYALNIPNF